MVLQFVARQIFAAVAFVVAVLATAAARRGQAASCADQLALRLAHAWQRAFVEAARRLADAARASVDTVRDEIARAARVVAPALDEIVLYEEREVRISASIGVAAFPLDAATANDLLERADAAMYHRKHIGRDGVPYVGVDGALTRLAAMPV